MLASRMRSFTQIRMDRPLSNDEIRKYAPSIFAEDKHESRSERYKYIPTIDVLDGLRKEGFEPFMAAQTRVRDYSKREHAKHVLRLRHTNQINAREANEIILLNSHDGSSSFQLLSGVFRFVCANGMICGDRDLDIRVPHKGDVVGRVIEGAYTVLDNFEQIDQQREAMEALPLSRDEQRAFATAALTVRYDDPLVAPPVTAEQILEPRRMADRQDDLWTTFNRVQENLVRGGLYGRNAKGRSTTTRAITGIDQSVKVNRALWVLSEEMRKLKG